MNISQSDTLYSAYTVETVDGIALFHLLVYI